MRPTQPTNRTLAVSGPTITLCPFRNGFTLPSTSLICFLILRSWVQRIPMQSIVDRTRPRLQSYPIRPSSLEESFEGDPRGDMCRFHEDASDSLMLNPRASWRHWSNGWFKILSRRVQTNGVKPVRPLPCRTRRTAAELASESEDLTTGKVKALLWRKFGPCLSFPIPLHACRFCSTAKIVGVSTPSWMS